MSRAGVLLLVSGCMGPWPGATSLDKDDADSSSEGKTIPLDELKAGFVYVGPVGDHGWSKTHDDGRKYLAEELGIETTYEPSVSPADTVAVVDEMIAEDVNIVFTTSYDFVSQTQQAAAIHRDAYFLSCSGGVWAENLTSYMARMYQPMYLAGMVAGHTTQTDHVAVLAAVPVPEVVRHVNAFTLGAREANPNVKVEVAWILNWFDPELETEYTLDFIAHGADVIQVQTDTTIAVEVSRGKTVTVGEQQLPVWSIGYDNIDACSHAPESCLTAPYWNWGPMYVEIVEQIRQGTWNPQEIRWDQIGTTPDSPVGLAQYNPAIPGNVRIAVDNVIPQLADPANVAMPFIGPIKDPQGSQRLASGEHMDDNALNRMCWHVEGVYNWDDSLDPPGLVPARVPNGCPGDP